MNWNLGRPWSDKKRELTVYMLGLDGAGSTTILYRLKYGELVPTDPTTCFNLEKFNYGGVKIIAWDLSCKRCQLGRDFDPNMAAILFVLDSTDEDRLDEAREFLHEKVLHAFDPEPPPLLVMANKQDLLSAFSPELLAERMSLSKLQNKQWHICGTSATTGTGLKPAFDWLVQTAIGESVLEDTEEPTLTSGRYDLSTAGAVEAESHQKGVLYKGAEWRKSMMGCRTNQHQKVMSSSQE